MILRRYRQCLKVLSNLVKKFFRQLQKRLSLTEEPFRKY